MGKLFGNRGSAGEVSHEVGAVVADVVQAFGARNAKGVGLRLSVPAPES